VRKHLAAIAATTLLLSGCALNSGLGATSQGGAGIVQIAPDRRHERITIAGQTLDGMAVSTQTMKGIVVVNAWASWCRNCAFEWRDLQTVSLANTDVHFLGLNESDTQTAAQAFLGEHPTSYQHIFDPHNVALNRIKDLPSVSIPTTLVLDQQHRVAARIMGRVSSKDLTKIIRDLRTE